VILVDTSAWVEYDRATASPVDRRLTELIGDDDQLAVTQPVIMQVIAGARNDEREADLRRLLLRCASYRSTLPSTSTPRHASTEPAGASASHHAEWSIA